MEDTHPIVVGFKAILDGPLNEFLHLSSQIGGEVKIQADMVADAFQAQVNFVSLAPRCKTPEQNELTAILKPTADKVQAIQAYREKNRPSKLINHLSAVSEACPALYWISVTPTPGPYVKEMKDAGQFYSNRVLMEYKDKDKLHVDWVKSWTQVLSDLQQYIKQYHTTGVSWNPRGGSVSEAQSGKPAAVGPTGRAPPPPPGPPPPLPSAAELAAFAKPAGQDDRAALFQQLNRGDEVTKGLRKVNADQQTHKNPSLRAQAAPPSKPTPGPRPFQPPGNVASPQAKPPKFELQGKKWIIEYHSNNHNLIVGEATMNQAVYIFACTDCTVQVKGKVNSITMDACKKCSLVFDDIVASVEFINCQRIQAQAMGKVATVSIDKTDGIQVYFSKTCLDTEVVSSKSSEMNILIPKADGDFVEYPVPEQYKTQWNGKRLSTVVVEQNA